MYEFLTLKFVSISAKSVDPGEMPHYSSGSSLFAIVQVIIFDPLKIHVSPMRIETNFKGYEIETPPNLNYANTSISVF